MIEIKPVSDRDVTEKEFLKQGFEFNDNSLLVFAKEKEEIIGKSFLRIENENLYIMQISPENDIMMFDGMLRSSIHIGLERGAKAAFYENLSCEKNYERLGFILDKENKSLDIGKLFTSCHGCS